MVYFNVYGFIDYDDILFRAPDAPRKRQNQKHHNPGLLPDIQMKIRAPPSSRKLLFPVLELRTPPRATKRQRTKKTPVQNKLRSAVCRSLFSEELPEQTKPIPSVYRNLQLLCRDMDNKNTNKDLNIAQQDTRQQFGGVQDFHLHDMQMLDAADQQRTPEAGSLKTCSDDKKKASMVSVLCDSSDKDVHHISAECNNVLME